MPDFAVQDSDDTQTVILENIIISSSTFFYFWGVLKDCCARQCVPNISICLLNPNTLKSKRRCNCKLQESVGWRYLKLGVLCRQGGLNTKLQFDLDLFGKICVYPNCVF